MLLFSIAYIQSAAVSTILLDIRASEFPVGSAGTFNGTSSQYNFSLYPTRYWSQEYPLGDFPGGPVGKTLSFHCSGASFIPGQGTRILHVLWWVQKKKKLSQECPCPVTQLCPTLSTQWTIRHEAPLSMKFFRQEYWSGLPFPLPRDLPNPGIELSSPQLAGRFFTCVPPGKTNPRARPNKHSAY